MINILLIIEDYLQAKRAYILRRAYEKLITENIEISDEENCSTL